MRQPAGREEVLAQHVRMVEANLVEIETVEMECGGDHCPHRWSELNPTLRLWLYLRATSRAPAPVIWMYLGVPRGLNSHDFPSESGVFKSLRHFLKPRRGEGWRPIWEVWAELTSKA